MSATGALVKRVRNPYFQDANRRSAERQECALEATSHPLEPGPQISWGAVVNDISSGGVGVTLCYPFRAGTYLAIDLPCNSGMVRTLMVRVVHVHDSADGTWRLGCEFVKPLSQSDMELMV